MTTVAIDFGTSNTVVSYLDPVTDTPQTFRFESISHFFNYGSAAEQLVYIVPSVVYVDTDMPRFGAEAQEKPSWQPRYFLGFKRELAADYRPLPREIDGERFSAETIAELFLSHIWQRFLAESPLESPPSTVVLTVPVGAFERYLTWFQDVSTHLGLPDVQLVDESTAAALGYAIQQPNALVLVIDFGGGTLDLSLVRTRPTSPKTVMKADVIAKAEAGVGGIDIDTWIVEQYLASIGSSREAVGEGGWQNLLIVAERLKIQLSDAENAKESWFDDENFLAHDLSLNREDFQTLLESRLLLEQVRQALDTVVSLAQSQGIAKSEIEQVLMVGGSARIAAVQQIVISYFGSQRVKQDKPFEAVAHGALLLGQHIQLTDILHHSYAIRLWDSQNQRHSFFPLVNKGQQYPYRRPEPLILQVASQGQKEIELDIGEVAEVTDTEVMTDAQGRLVNRQLVQHTEFRPLGRSERTICVAHLDPPGEIGQDRIQLDFEVNEQRILVATVVDTQTGQTLLKRESVATLQ